jgi:hypothetical protein
VQERIVRRGWIALLLAAAIIVPAGDALAAAPQQPMAGIGVRLVVPAGSRDGARARPYIVEQVAPGVRIRRRVEILNSTSSAKNVAIYPAAASLQHGTFGFAPSHSRNELTGWTSVSRDVLHLRSGASAFETVTISVPKDAAPGDRYAVIWAEVSATSANGIALVNRVGIRVYLTIGGPPANFAIGQLTAGRSVTGEPLVSATIRNSGQRTLEIGGTLTLAKGPGGLRADPSPVKLERALAPDDSQRLTVRLDEQLPRGPWHARLRLTSGPLHRATEATITFPRAAPAEPARLNRVEIVLGLLALAGIALLILRRSSLFRRDSWLRSRRFCGRWWGGGGRRDDGDARL